MRNEMLQIKIVHNYYVHRTYLCVWKMFEHFETVDLIRYLFWFFNKKEYALNQFSYWFY